MWEDGTLNRYTAETREHELNLKVHYMHLVEKRLPWLHFDTDVQKTNRGHKQPDGIYHRRGHHRLNFLVVEIKRQRDAAGADDDLEKIRNDWFAHPLSYRFGASVLLRENDRGFAIRLISNDQPNDETGIATGENFEPVQLPRYNRIRLATLRTLADEVADGRDARSRFRRW